MEVVVEEEVEVLVGVVGVAGTIVQEGVDIVLVAVEEEEEVDSNQRYRGAI